MKTKNIYILALIFIFLSTSIISCTDNFEELNTNPNQPSSVEPAPLFTAVQLQLSGIGSSRRGSIGFGMMMVQQTATLKVDDLEGDKYLRTESASVFFSNAYENSIPNLVNVLDITESDPEKVNLHAAARILWVMQMHRLTDTYGNIPYFEAGKGYLEQIYYPKYDRQEDIYKDMLKELDEAVNSFDPSKSTYGKADLFYNGDIDKWKKLGNSLMLKLGLRLSKVDANLAKEWVGKAIQKGVMTDESDICTIHHEGTVEETANPIAFDFMKFDLVRVGDIKISKTFLDHLQSTNDPRIASYASLPNGDNTLSAQKGLPNGHDATSILTHSGGGDLSTYSTFNTNTLLALDAVTVLFSYAEVELMLAETAVRNWYNGNAKTHYEKAIKASMHQQKLYGTTISEQEINTYLLANPYPASASEADQLKVINEQYWVSTFLNGWESYANWRRTGIPELQPVNYQNNASNGEIPRRLTYPRTEYGTNGNHLQEAINEQGADTYSTRVWWDTKG